MCWFGGAPYPKKIRYCIDSWKKYLPDYEIMLWDAERFDINSFAWVREANDAGKYAFMADYVRFFAIYNYGGIYLDCDVEVIKPFDDLLDLPYFVGTEAYTPSIELSAFGAEKGLAWLKDAMDYYMDRHFIKESGERDMVALPYVMWPVLSQKYEIMHIDDSSEFDPDPSKICVFPQDWFNANPWPKENGCRYHVTEKTRCIHHFANSWLDTPYDGGRLHKLYYKLTGKDWKLSDKRFRLYGKQNKNKTKR